MSNTKYLKQLGSKKTKYPKKPNKDILETFDAGENNPEYKLVTLTQERDEFTSLCPKTGQPDFAKIEVIYVPREKMIESKSYKLYLFSFRNTGEFHEHVIQRIFNDLWDRLEPYYLRVFGDFAPRGGIAIKPLISEYAGGISNQSRERINERVNNWDNRRK